MERDIPALKEKKVVICDRYYYSNIAYQGAVGINPEEIKRINEKFAVIPDAVLYLKVDVDEGLHRIKSFRNSKLTAFEKADFLKRPLNKIESKNIIQFKS